MNADIKAIVIQLQEIELQKKLLKDNYLTIICDQSITLEERWQFFITFDNNLKNKLSINFIPSVFNKTFPNFDWYKDLGYLPNVTINLVGFVQLIEASIKYEQTDNNNYLNNKIYSYYRQNPQAISFLKEDILKNNLLSFIYIV